MIYVSTFLFREKDVGHTLQIPEVGVSKVTLISVCYKGDRSLYGWGFRFHSFKYCQMLIFFNELSEWDVLLATSSKLEKRKHTIF